MNNKFPAIPLYSAIDHPRPSAEEFHRPVTLRSRRVWHSDGDMIGSNTAYCRFDGMMCVVSLAEAVLLKELGIPRNGGVSESQPVPS